MIYRNVDLSYQKQYDFLMQSGLYNALIKEYLLLEHVEINIEKYNYPNSYKILHPQQIDFISYPYSWSFSMLKDAALLTLKIQKIALKYGMILKDASAYNIQFVGCRPIFIDTLSFDIYEEGKPWQAYGQFCRHFLAPLALMSKVDVSLSKLLITHLYGVPIPLASKLLPYKTKFNLGLYLHIHLHAKTQISYQDKKVDTNKNKISRKSIKNLIENLSSTISALSYLSKGTEWGEYYNKDVI